MSDLELVSSEELSKELKSRFDVLVICGWKDMDDKRIRYHVDWKGGVGQAMGAADYAQSRFDWHAKREIEDEIARTNEEEEGVV